jgi:DNA-binding NarL/FixJ family response regulator
VEDLVLHITPWERAALELLADGTPTGALAERFGTNEADLEARLSTLFARMGVLGRAEAVDAASRRGLLTRRLHPGQN